MKFVMDGDEVCYPRDVQAFYELECPKCKQTAVRTEPNDEELSEFGCGRSYECCSVTYECPEGHRTTLSLEAPEPDYD